MIKQVRRARRLAPKVGQQVLVTDTAHAYVGHRGIIKRLAEAPNTVIVEFRFPSLNEASQLHFVTVLYPAIVYQLADASIIPA